MGSPSWTLRDVARELGVSLMSVRRYVQDPADPLPAYRLSGTPRGRLRFDPSAVRLWLRRRSNAVIRASLRDRPAQVTAPDHPEEGGVAHEF